MSRGGQNNGWARCARPQRKHSRLAWVGKHDFKASACPFTLRLAHLLPPPRNLCRGTLWRRAGGRAAPFHANPKPRRHAGQNFSRAEAAAGATLPAKRSRYSRSAGRSVLNRRTALPRSQARSVLIRRTCCFESSGRTGRPDANFMAAQFLPKSCAARSINALAIPVGPPWAKVFHSSAPRTAGSPGRERA